MEKIVNDLLKEELYYEKMENGLDVYFMPKKGFTKKYAVLATNYGSNDLEFIPINEKEKIVVNAGTRASYTSGYHGMYFLVEKKGMQDVKTTLKKGANYANSMKL